jgi:O-Antigen ligase
MISTETYNPGLTEQAHHPPGGGHASKGYWAVIAMPVITAALLFSPGATLLLYTFPFMAVVIALYLYRRNRALYVSLVCWLWFLTPLVRRILDYRAGWTQPTAVLLAPPLATCVPLLWLIPDWRRVFQRRAAPLICVLITCIYATFLGIITLGARFVFQDLLTWLSPLIFAFMLTRHREQAPELFRAFEKAFIYGLLVASAYGVYQFFFLPRWDAFWMGWVLMESIGKPQPTEVRVFSTMNGPQILASFLATGLIVAFNSHRWIRFVAIPLGLLCLVLSLARSGWVAMAAGTIYLLFTLSHQQRFRMVVAALLCAVAMLLALQNPDLQDVMSQRFDSFSDVKNDTSFMDRVDAYQGLFDGLMINPFGVGMGATPAVAEDKVTLHRSWNQDLGDSTVAMVIITMGVAGALVLVSSLLLLGRMVFMRTSVNVTYMNTVRAILIGLIAEAALDGVISGPTGFLTWAAIGFGLALGIADDEIQPEIAAVGVTA